MPELLVAKPDEQSPQEGETKEQTTEVSKGDEKPAAVDEAPAARAVVGIIYPPPEVRNIVDKTADFVARNGPEFESRIKLNEAGNTKFNFLNSHDPYNAYYQHKIKEIQEGVAQEKAAAQQPGYVAPKVAPISMTIEAVVPKEAPPDFEFTAEPPSISGQELDVVKLTAQFVARNGAQFLDKLMMREQRNYQFDFLRKQHPLFSYFTKLVEQYTKVLNPSKEMLASLRNDLENPFRILDRAKHRGDWQLYQEKQKRQAEEKEERERVEYAQIDWHDFILVETIDFKESEMGYLPPPIKPTQLAQRLLQQQKYERLADESGDVEEIEMEVEEQDTEQMDQTGADTSMEQEGGPSSPPPRPPSPPPPKARPLLPPGAAPTGPVQIRKDYNPKSSHPTPAAVFDQDTSGQFLISPITGEKIPAHKMEEHMRYSLLDPRWVEDQKKQIAEKKTQKDVFEEGMQIGSNLKLLAERRTDIFGMEETMIGQKIGEEAVPKTTPTVQWDGHSGSADMAKKQAHENIAEQLEAIKKANELIDKARQGPERPKEHPQPITSHPPHMPRPQAPTPLFTPPRSMLPHPSPHHPPMMGGPGMHPQHQMIPPHMQHGPPMHPGPPGLMQRPPPGLMQLPNSAPPIPGMPDMLRPPMQQPRLPQPDIAPPVTKKPRTEAEELVPELEFITQNPGSVTFKVQVPNIPDRQEWKLGGQFVSITLPITDPVSVIKAKLFDELGMPTGKQKLQIGGLFLKDSNCLGFYNVTQVTVVTLALKERGGRKK